MVALEDCFPDTATMIMVYSIDGIIENDHWAFNVLGFCQQDR